MEALDAILFAAIGLTTGFLAGMLGAGGGFATVVLLLVAGVNAHDAVGTSLLYVVVVAAWGSSVHLRHATADWRLALVLGAASAATASIGAKIADGLSERTIVALFALLMGAVAAMFLIRSRSDARKAEAVVGAPPLDGDEPARKPVRRSLRMTVLALAGGAAIGVLQGLLGVGGGFLLVPFMILLLRVPENIAVGTSLMTIVIGGLSGAIGHLALGNVRLKILAALLPGGLVGAYFGAAAVRRMSPERIRSAFLALVGASAAYLIVRAL